MNEPPLVRGLPVLGSVLPLVRDPMGLMLDAYRRHGAVFRLEVMHRRFVVLAGPEANQFVARTGGEYLVTAPFWRRFSREVDAERILPGMDGPAHLALRKVMQRAYSRGAITARFPEAIGIIRRVLARYRPGESIVVVELMQRIVTEQLGLLIAGRAPGDYFDDLVRFVHDVLNVTIIGRYPRVFLLSPGFRRAQRRIVEFAEQLIAAHRGSDRSARDYDLIDDLVAALEADPRLLSRSELVAAALGPFIAGLDTVASTCAFMLYALLGNPLALERVRADSDRFSSNPTPETLRSLTSLQGAALETLRVHPIAPFLGRGARRTFEFAGRRIEEGTDVLAASTLTHRLPEFFPAPDTFDIDRYAAPRNEHLQKGSVFAPFGLGAHTCLGSGFAEVQVMLTMATILNQMELALDPRDFRLVVRMDPTPTPGSALRVRYLSRRGN